MGFQLGKVEKTGYIEALTLRPYRVMFRCSYLWKWLRMNRNLYLGVEPLFDFIPKRLFFKFDSSVQKWLDLSSINWMVLSISSLDWWGLTLLFHSWIKQASIRVDWGVEWLLLTPAFLLNEFLEIGPPAWNSQSHRALFPFRPRLLTSLYL